MPRFSVSRRRSVGPILFFPMERVWDLFSPSPWKGCRTYSLFPHGRSVRTNSLLSREGVYEYTYILLFSS